MPSYRSDVHPPLYFLGAPTLAGLFAARKRTLLSALIPRSEVWLNRSILIRKPRAEVYDAWRELGGVARLFDQLVKVDDQDVVEERPGEALRWRGAAHEGSVELCDYPDPSSTMMTVDLRFDAAVSPVFRGIMRTLTEQQLSTELTALRGFIEDRADTHGVSWERVGEGGLERAARSPTGSR